MLARARARCSGHDLILALGTQRQQHGESENSLVHSAREHLKNEGKREEAVSNKIGIWGLLKLC